MAAVVNHLRFRDAIDPKLFIKAEHDLTARMRSIPGFEDFYVVQTSDTEVTLVSSAILSTCWSVSRRRSVHPG
jgi:hypothetical protein